LLPVV
jgi:hypothetical protein